MTSVNQTQAAIEGSSHVFLVADPARSSQFYQSLGFKYEEIGGPNIKHIHVSRDKLTLILHPAADPALVRPISSVEGGPQWDAFAYTDYADLLFEAFKSAGATVAYGLNRSRHWNEFAIQDPDGYIIAVGGGVFTSEVYY